MYGLHYDALNETYLNSKTQTSNTSGEQSTPWDVVAVCPVVSTLGSILVLIRINRLPCGLYSRFNISFDLH